MSEIEKKLSEFDQRTSWASGDYIRHGDAHLFCVYSVSLRNRMKASLRPDLDGVVGEFEVLGAFASGDIVFIDANDGLLCWLHEMNAVWRSKIDLGGFLSRVEWDGSLEEEFYDDAEVLLEGE